MFTLPPLVELYRHLEWADATVWRAVRAHPAAEGDRRLHVLLYHIHMVQQAFLQVWRGVAPVFREPDDFANLAAIESWARAYYPVAIAHLSTLNEAELAKPIALPWAAMLAEQIGRPPGATTLGETIFQVTSHSTYHRGQVNARLRELGGLPPLVDYIAWIWFDRPAPAWPQLAPAGQNPSEACGW